MPAALWQIIGGGANGGILVREFEEVTSNPLAGRLATGSIVQELELKGERLHYKLRSGYGPHQGWVTVVLKGKQLAIPKHEGGSRPTPRPKDVEHGEKVRMSSPGRVPSKSAPNVKVKPGSSSIRVSAFSMSGKGVVVNVERGCNVADLKTKLVQEWQYPPECLKIILEGASLADDEQLSSLCPGNDSALSITVLVSLEELYSFIEGNRLPGAQVKALRKLATLVPRGCERTVDMMSKCLESKAPSVRREAVQTLLQVAGAERTLAEVEARFDHQDIHIRLHAIGSWKALLPQDIKRDDYVLSKMDHLAEDLNADVRQPATDMIKEALKNKRCRRGDPFLVKLAQAHLKKFAVVNSDLWVDLLWATCEFAEAKRAEDLAIFIDARDTDEFDVSCIAGAVTLPLAHKSILDHLPGHPVVQLIQEKPECWVFVYSDTGTPMSRCGMVSRHLRKPPHTHRIFRLIDGLNRWKEKNLPVEGDTRYMFAGAVSPTTMLWS